MQSTCNTCCYLVKQTRLDETPTCLPTYFAVTFTCTLSSTLKVCRTVLKIAHLGIDYWIRTPKRSRGCTCQKGLHRNLSFGLFFRMDSYSRQGLTGVLKTSRLPTQMRFCVGNPLVTKFLCGQVKLFGLHMQLQKALQQAYSVANNAATA